jgi:peptide/nickel transport system permease protein
LGAADWLALGWLVAVALGALLAPVLPLDDPEAVSLAPRSGPSSANWLGTDGNGRDLFSRIVWGGRASLILGVGALAVGTVVGGALGLLAGYFRGRIDRAVTGVFNVMLAVPQLLFALALVAILASDDEISSTRRLMVLVLALGVVSVPIVGRITRAATLSWADRDFVLAARSVGASDRRILVREILPNVVPTVGSMALLGMAMVIVAEGGLSLLGAGVQLPTPSWGNIIAEGRALLPLGAPYAVFYPSVVIFLTVLALNHLGDVVRARHDRR